MGAATAAARDDDEASLDSSLYSESSTQQAVVPLQWIAKLRNEGRRRGDDESAGGNNGNSTTHSNKARQQANTAANAPIEAGNFAWWKGETHYRGGSIGPPIGTRGYGVTSYYSANYTEEDLEKHCPAGWVAKLEDRAKKFAPQRERMRRLGEERRTRDDLENYPFDQKKYTEEMLRRYAKSTAERLRRKADANLVSENGAKTSYQVYLAEKINMHYQRTDLEKEILERQMREVWHDKEAAEVLASDDDATSSDDYVDPNNPDMHPFAIRLAAAEQRAVANELIRHVKKNTDFEISSDLGD